MHTKIEWCYKRKNKLLKLPILHFILSFIRFAKTNVLLKSTLNLHDKHILIVQRRKKFLLTVNLLNFLNGIIHLPFMNGF